MGVLLGTEHTEDVVILVHRLAKVALLLRIPPATVWISVGTLQRGRVGVVVVLPSRLVPLNTERQGELGVIWQPYL